MTSTSPVALSASSSLTSFMTSWTASPGPLSSRALAPVTGVMLTLRSLASGVSKYTSSIDVRSSRTLPSASRARPGLPFETR